MQLFYWIIFRILFNIRPYKAKEVRQSYHVAMVTVDSVHRPHHPQFLIGHIVSQALLNSAETFLPFIHILDFDWFS